MNSIWLHPKQIPVRCCSSILSIALRRAFVSRGGKLGICVLGWLALLMASSLVHAQAVQYAYVTDFGSNAISVFRIDPTSGALTMSSVAPTGINPFAVAIDPTGRFAYVSNSADVPGGVPSISVYSIDPNTGALTPVPGSPFPTAVGSPYGLAVHPSGKFLYVAHDLSASFVSAFGINPSTGALTPLPGSPYPTGLNTWSVTTDPAGKFLFVANGTSGNIPAYTIDATTGALTPVAGSPFASQHDVDSVVVHPSGRFLYADNSAFNTVSGYSIDSTSGALTPVAGSPFPTAASPIGVVTDSAGRFLYAANRDSGTVSAFSINSGSGAMTPVSGSPFPVGSLPYHATIDSTNSFLYVTNFNSNNVTAYAINASTGGLTPVAGSPFATGTQPFWIAIASVTPSTQLAIVPNVGGNTGNVTVQLFGGGAQNGATVKLTGLGPDIVGATVTRALVPTTIFALAGATPGVRDVMVTNPDGTSATLAGGFTVEQGGAPDISVEIVGRTQIRFGKAQTYYISVRNSGNVDAGPGLVSLSFPQAVQYVQQSGTDLFSAGVTFDPEYGIPSPSNSGNQNLVFATSGVPPGGNQFAPTQLTLPVGASLTTTAASLNPSFTLTAGWQQDITNLSLDDFLGLEGMPFIPFPPSGCPACLNQYSAELQAHSDVLVAYNSYQTAKGNLDSALVSLPVEIGKTVSAAFLVESTGITGLGGILLGETIGELDLCAKNLFSDVTRGNQSCFQSVQGQLTIEANAIAAALSNGLTSAAQRQALGLFSIQINTLVAAFTAAGNIFDARGMEQLALGTFQQSLGPYRLARQAYKTCLSPTTCSAPPLPPQPSPPGTSLPVTGVDSIDPNDKIGLRGAGPQGYVSGAAPFAYSVYFGNKDTATAPAQQVTVTDQLDVVHDDLNGLSFGSVWFENQLISLPPLQTRFATTVDLRPATNLLVAVSANLNTSNGLATWNFQSLDPATSQPPTDPTAGFLPAGADGGVFFTVRPKVGLATNTQVQNQATIIFDANPPINTPLWTNTIDASSPSSQVTTLPAFENSVAFPVLWSGTDLGAGIQDFTVYVSDNGGAFSAFQTNATATSATFAGQAGHTYAFYSIARDLVGNVESPKTIAEATTETGLAFMSLTAKAEIKTNSRHPGFEMRGAFTLGTGSSGIAPDTQSVTLVLGNFSTTIPAGSFRKNRKGNYTFEGTINGASVEFGIAPAGSSSFTFHVEATGANLAGAVNPVTVQLLIGTNGGTTQLNAETD